MAAMADGRGGSRRRDDSGNNRQRQQTTEKRKGEAKLPAGGIEQGWSSCGEHGRRAELLGGGAEMEKRERAPASGF
jgi:hypothetical protein